jgi:hypothetical protein
VPPDGAFWLAAERYSAANNLFRDMSGDKRRVHSFQARLAQVRTKALYLRKGPILHTGRRKTRFYRELRVKLKNFGHLSPCRMVVAKLNIVNSWQALAQKFGCSAVERLRTGIASCGRPRKL